VKKHNWKLTNPEREFPGRIVLISSKDTPVEKLLPWLGAALASGYPEVSLAFLKREVIERPVLGRLQRHHQSATRLRLTLVLGDRAVIGTLTASSYRGYQELAQAATALRREGREARLALPDTLVNTMLRSNP